jgi:hypothetical protein
MAETLKPVLIGDPNHDRFEWMQKILDEEFSISSVQAETFDDLQKLVEKSQKSRELAEENNPNSKRATENDWSIIFIADNLPPTHAKKSSAERVKVYLPILEYLNKWNDFIIILITTPESSIDLRGVTPQPPIITLSIPPKPEEHSYFIKEVEKYGKLKHIPGANSKIIWDKNNRIFRERICSLSDNRNLQEAEDHLSRLIRKCLDCNKVEKIEIKQLGQGKSGARVFRLCVDDKSDEDAEIKNQEHLIKLYEAGAVWKLESEVNGYLKARRKLEYEGYRKHLPELNPAHIPYGDLLNLKENQYIVNSGHWYAVHYDFLGGERFGKFIDIETALVESAEELKKKLAETKFALKTTEADEVRATRLNLLEIIVKWLCEAWYANPKPGYVERKVKKVWDIGDAPEQQYIDLPPYQFTGKSKGLIRSFLNSQEAEMGARFFTDWEKHVNKVFRLVSEDTPADDQLGKLTESIPVVLSPAHGDLNPNNILLWLNHNHPFLIDFPLYQEAGHALQDFARLEVEIKFALLDRQKDSPEQHLRAFEYTHSQMSIWQEMEDRLLNQWDQKDFLWSAEGYSENVQLCYEAVQLVRREAYKVQQNSQCPGPPAGDFLTEYWPALLYHTARAIGYTSALSVFNRLLAVYSASSILTKLNCFPDID